MQSRWWSHRTKGANAMANPADPVLRELTDEDRERIDAARKRAYFLYEGREVPHRSCGIALAETFGLETRPYQALRRGGITGEGECGAIKAGELILGELLGDPDPTGAVSPALRAAATLYRSTWCERLDLGPGGAQGSIICRDLTDPLGAFLGEERHGFCTRLVAEVASVVAEVLLRLGASVEIPRSD